MLKSGMFSDHYDEDPVILPHQELLNCLAEALPHAQVHADPIEYSGTGRFAVTIQHPVFCKSTDAFAGCITVAVHREPSEEQAEAWVAENYQEPHDLYVSIEDTEPDPEPKVAMAWTNDDIPF